METISYKGYDIEIGYDSDPINPREDDNFGKMVCFHRRYTLGDKHEFTMESIKELINTKGVYFYPLFLYDHSGITMAIRPFSCPWDSGQVGVIYCTADTIREEFNVKRLNKTIIDKAKKIMQNEVKAYDQYLTGEIYYFNIIGIDESGYGWYDKDDAIEEAKSVIDFRLSTIQPEYRGVMI